MVRFKKRYLVVEIVPEMTGHSLFGKLQAAVFNAVKQIHGDFGVGAIMRGFNVKSLSQGTSVAFLCVARGPHRLVASALPFITEVGNVPARVRSLHVAASMRHGFLFLQKYHEKKVKEMEERLCSSEMKEWEVMKKNAYRTYIKKPSDNILAKLVQSAD